MTNGMTSWDVTDIEVYINETVSISWAPLYSYLVLCGTKNFKWMQRSSYHGPRDPWFTSNVWNSHLSTVVLMLHWLLSGWCWVWVHLLCIVMEVSINRNPTPGKQEHNLPPCPRWSRAQVFLATPPCTIKSSKVMGRICTVKLLSGHNVKIVQKGLSWRPASQMSWFFNSEDSELYKCQDRFTWLLDHPGNGLRKEMPLLLNESIAICIYLMGKKWSWLRVI